MKKVKYFILGWLIFLSAAFVIIKINKPQPNPTQEFIGWEVTYSGPTSPEGETFITEFIPSYKHMPSAGYLHFTCNNGSVTTYILWSRVIKVEEVYGHTSILSDHEVECVFGKESLRVPGIKIT